MKKWILAVGGVVAVGLLATPYFLGLRMQHLVEHDLENHMTLGGLQADLEIQDYRRGWLQSSATASVRFTRQNKPDQDFSLVFKPLTIEHGPIVWTGKLPKIVLGAFNGKIQLTKAMQAKLARVLPKDSAALAAKLKGHYSLTQRLNLTMDLPAFSYVTPGENLNIDWQGISKVLTMSKDGQNFHSQTNFSGAKIVGQGGSLWFKPASFLLDSDYQSERNWQYLADMQCDGMVIKLPEGELVYKNLLLQSQLKASLTGLDLHITVGLDYGQQAGYQFGPLAFTFKLTELDVEVGQQMGQFLRQANQARNVEQARKQASMQAMLMVPKLLQKGLQAQLETLSLELPEGVIKASGGLTLPKGAQNIFTAMREVSARFDLSVPTVIAQRLMTEYMQRQNKPLEEGLDLIKTWAKQGYIRKVDKHYEVQCQLAGGQISWHGQTLP